MKPYRLYIKHNGFFIAYTPKVASTSIKTALNAKGSLLCYAHQIPEGSRVIGWIRDPMDRAMSCYRFLSNNPGVVRTFNSNWTFDRFMEHVYNNLLQNQHWTPHYLLHKDIITELYSYESIPVTFKEVTGVELKMSNSSGTKVYNCDQKKFYEHFGRDQYLWEVKCIR